MSFEHPSLTDRIYQHLKDEIIRHRLEPGARLLDQEIANHLGVSRTPVREAITRLGAEGLVDIVPRRGVFVTDLSSKDIKDLYEVREVLEVLAVKLAVPLLTDEDLSVLKEALDQFAVALDNREYLICFESDRKFHDQVVALSRNTKLIEINEHLGGNIQATRWRRCRDGDRQELSLQEHRAILHALVDRDAELAAQLVQEHIESAKRDLLANQQRNV